MTELASLLRGLRSRAGSNIMILIVAVVAVAAATAGPAYYAAGQNSILQDSVASASVLGRGFEATQSGNVSGTLNLLQTEISADLSAGRTPPASAAEVAAGTAPTPGLGGPTEVRRLLQAPIGAIQATAFEPTGNETIPVVWRDGACGHLRLTGTCPQAPGQVIISRSLAATNGWHQGQRLKFPTWGTFIVTGIYEAPFPGQDYWFAHEFGYFAYENPLPENGKGPPPPLPYDAMFTARATLENAPASVQGAVVVDGILQTTNLRPGDVAATSKAIAGLVGNQQLIQQQAVVTSDIPATLSSVQTGWSALAVPVLLITAQLLGLAWLLLFLVVTEAVDARGPEVALAKLRGHGRLRTLGFGLSEPVALLAVSLPVGALAGWAVTRVLGHVLLRPGTYVGLPVLAWATAAAACVGGLAAVALASQRTLRRPVVEQWRRAGRRAAERGWVVDGMLLTAAAAGLLELSASGQISSAHHSAMSLLVPGLLGLAVAVVASRLLPLACRVALARGRGFGGLGTFLALRHVARRPGGARTTIMLATSFALATFAVSAWAVERSNIRTLAGSQVGAPTVLAVSVPLGVDLGAVVAKADPSGRLATAVDDYDLNGTATVAVDPQRWAGIATLPAHTTRASLRRLAGALDAEIPPPLVLTGDSIRLTVTVQSLAPALSGLIADVDTASGAGPTPVSFDALPTSGTVTLTQSLAGCPCLLQDLTLVPNPSNGGGNPLQGTVTFSGLQERGPRGWQVVRPGFAALARWSSPDAPASVESLSEGASGLRWSFNLSGPDDAVLVAVNRPDPIPALAASSLTGGEGGRLSATGLDGGPLPVQVVATLAAVPGAPANGVVVDRQFAEQAANENLDQITQQVWLASGGASRIEPKLKAAGIQILYRQDQSVTEAMLGRQGPGLARVLFLAEAGAAAALAAGGAILSMYLFARRRRYEFAALAATGLSNRTLLVSLAAEQLIVLVFGVAVGMATGLVAAVVALKDVPEFLVSPTAPPLSFFPPLGQLAAILGIIVAAVLAAAATASITLIRGVKLEQLREAPA